MNSSPPSAAAAVGEPAVADGNLSGIFLAFQPRRVNIVGTENIVRKNKTERERGSERGMESDGDRTMILEKKKKIIITKK